MTQGASVPQLRPSAARRRAVEAAPAEGWERVHAGFSAWKAGLVSRHRVLGTILRRFRVWGLWTALLLLIVLLVVSPQYRSSVHVYAACFWLLVLWFAVGRMKTVRWASVARMFSAGMAWSVVIAWVSFQLTSIARLGVRDPGAGAAIAGITEETLKLFPLVVVAVIAPGRVRRFAATDWLLLGFASGLGFQAWEDMLRRLSASIQRPGLLDLLLGMGANGPGSGYPQYGLGLLSGGSGVWRGSDALGYAGHHVCTALIAGCAGLGVAVWRSAARVTPRASLRFRVAAVLLPLQAWTLCVSDHVSYNAVLNDPRWADAGDVSTPWLIRAVWSATGHGTGRQWLLLLLLVACLMVDAWRLHSVGPWTDLPEAPTSEPESLAASRAPVVGGLQAARPVGSGASWPTVTVPPAELPRTGWWVQPRLVVDRQLAGAFAGLMGSSRTLVGAMIALSVHVARDLVVIVGAHSRRDVGQPLGAALTEGRAAAAMLREVREEAMGAVAARVVGVPGRAGIPGRPAAQLEVALELSRRLRFRLAALSVLAVIVAAGTVLAALVAQRVGTDLTPPAVAGDALHWLAGQFDSLSAWWAARTTGQKVLIGVGVTALFALSGGSLTLAFGASGVLTYGLEHGDSAADFMRHPGSATRRYLNSATPAQFALDALEFALTFAPGNFGGAAVGRGMRTLAREYADDPVAFMARRRTMLATDRGAVDLEAFRHAHGGYAEWVTDALPKIPDTWGIGAVNRKGVGFRWTDPTDAGSGVRIDQGTPGHPLPSQRVDHVIVRVNGNVLDRTGRPITGSIKDNAEMAHIPLSVWKEWSAWFRP